MMPITFGRECDFDGCDDYAEYNAGRADCIDGAEGVEQGAYCLKHAVEVAKIMHPEYVCKCPNCSCILGVN